jgi:hypothetical protein
MNVMNFLIIIGVFMLCGVALFQLLRFISKDLDFIHVIMKVKNLFKSKHKN